jgi:hypothetical protein
MKLRHLVTTLAAAAAVMAFTGCGNSKADETAAVENFKKEAESLSVWMKDKQKHAQANPMAGISTLMKEMTGKLKAMQNDKLPADLKEAFGALIAQLSKMEALVAEMGGDPAEMYKKASADPTIMKTFREKAQAIETEMRPINERLQEVGKKYGIDKIGFVGSK